MLMTQAWQAFAAGQMTDAARLGRQVLVRDPRSTDAMQCLGLALVHIQRSAEGIALLERSVRSHVVNLTHLANLADAYRLVGRADQAIACCRRGLAIHDEHPDLLHNLGAALLDSGKSQEAIPLLRKAADIRPTFAPTWFNLGSALLADGHPADAVEALRQCQKLQPDLLPGLRKLGEALIADNQFDEAVGIAHRTIEIDPSDPRHHHLLGVAFIEGGRPAAGIAAFRACLQSNPNYVPGLRGLAAALVDEDEVEAARSTFERAIALDRDNKDLRNALGHTLLILGDWQRGWDELECRWEFDNVDLPNPRFPQPLWDGGHYPQSTLLLHCEQGFGDCIMAARYIPLVTGRVGRVIVSSYPTLMPLFSGLPGVSALIPRGEPLPGFDLHCPLMTLPRIFHASSSNPAPAERYLRAPESLSRIWSERLQTNGTIRVGLVWACGKLTRRGAYRSMPLGALEPLSTLPNVTFYGLQVGPEAAELHETKLAIHDLSPDLADMGVTAAVLENLDLLLAVDTGVAHLGGALGIPTWVMLAKRRNWRWPCDTGASPWYSSTRVFRQSAFGDWTDVVLQVKHALESLSPGQKNIRSDAGV